MSKPPKAAIKRFHKLTDEALAVWQSDIRPWLQDEERNDTAVPLSATTADADVHRTAEWGRHFRHHIEPAEALGIAEQVAALVEGE